MHHYFNLRAHSQRGVLDVRLMSLLAAGSFVAIQKLPDNALWAMIRIAFALIIATTIAGLAVRNLREESPRSTLVPLLWIGTVVVFTLALQVHVPNVAIDEKYREFTFVAATLAIVILPARLLWLLAPREGLRRTLTPIAYLVVAILIATNS